ncbi:MAG: sulfurtransferase [Acidimicrobiales bacterium]
MVDPVVTMQWLRDREATSNAEGVDGVVLADVRWYLDGRSGHEAYLRGHIPGAVFVDLESCLAGPGGPQAGRHPLPGPEVFAAGMRRSGISDATTVVAYDDAGGVIAARLVWMLRVTGHDAALLDGGIDAYEGPLDDGEVTREPGVFSRVEWPSDRLVDIDDLEGPGLLLLDARDRGRFDGDVEPIDPRRGHIPGARNLPCRQNLDADGRVLQPAKLRERFEAVGVDDTTNVVSYCGSGVTACFNLILLELAGFPPGRLYPGSWSQYSHAAERPVA